MNRRELLGGVMLAATLGLGSQVVAQDYPTKPVTIIVPASPGGGLDIATRKTAPLMSEFLGQNVIIENRPGAASVPGTRDVVEADPDGYTLLAHASTYTMYPYTVKNLGFDPLTDLIPVGVMLRQTNVYSVGRDSPFTTFPELIEHAKANPDDLLFAHGGIASPQGYTVELVKLATGAKLEGVQYKGAGEAFPDVIAGRVSMISSGYAGQAGFFELGQLKPLAVSSGSRIAALPDVPTLKELGIDVESQAWLGILAPVGTPEPIIAKLSQAIRFASENTERRAEIERDGSDPTFLTPTEYRDLIAAEFVTFGELANATGLQPQ